MKKKYFLLAFLLAVISAGALAACGRAEFTVSFVDGDTVAGIRKTDGNALIDIPKISEKEGYVLSGWFYDDGVWLQPFKADSFLYAPLTGDISVYAKWDIRTYTLTFKTHGEAEITRTVAHGCALTDVPAVPEREGYGGGVWDTADFSGITADMEIRAEYTPNRYNLTYNYNGADTAGEANAEVVFDSPYALEIPSRQGYDFTGWYLDGEETQLTGGNGESLNAWSIPSDRELYAGWDTARYGITYHNTEGLANNNPDSYTMFDEEILLNYPDAQGRFIVGWYDNPAFEGDLVRTIESGRYGEINLYARWENYYGLTYEINGPAEYPNAFFYEFYEAGDIDKLARGTKYYGDLRNHLVYEIVLYIEGCSVTGFDDSAADVIIAPYFKGVPVIQILDAFYLSDNLKSLYIPATVLEIGNAALAQCAGLETVTIEDGSALTVMGNSSVSNCPLLKAFSFPAGLLYMDTDFYGCDGILSFTVDPDNKVFLVEEGILFSKDKSKLIRYPSSKSGAAYTIPQSVTALGICAFSGAQALEEIFIPPWLESFGAGAFARCPSLESVSFGENGVLRTLEYNAFYECVSLESIEIPKYITSIEFSSFAGCTGLQSVTFTEGSGLIVLANGLFKDCANLKDVLLPDGLETISDNAFAGCTSLNSVSIPESVSSVQRYSFKGAGLVRAADGILYAGKWAVDCTDAANYVIEEGTTGIASEAFSGCAALSVSIPASVKHLGINAFAFSVNLQTATFGNGSLLESIGISAFRGSALTAIEIPARVKLIDTNAFADCASLASVTFQAGCQLSDIKNYAFDGCRMLSGFALPATVKAIGTGAFRNCVRLNTFLLTAAVTSIGNNAFNGWTALQAINIKGYSARPSGWNSGWATGCNAVITWNYTE